MNGKYHTVIQILKLGIQMENHVKCEQKLCTCLEKVIFLNISTKACALSSLCVCMDWYILLSNFRFYSLLAVLTAGC